MFSDDTAKKSMTSVDKSDDEKNGPSLIWNNWNICRQCILKEKKSFIAKQTETSCDQNNIWDKYFWWYCKKSTTSVMMKKIGPSLVWNNSNICRQRNLKEKKSSIAKQTETSFDQNNILDKYFLMILQKKRDKCRQVWRWKKNGPSLVWNNSNICRQCNVKEKKSPLQNRLRRAVTKTIYWINIFWWYCKKSTTSVTMKKIGPSLVWNNSNICRQCNLKEKKKSPLQNRLRRAVTKTIYWINIFWWYCKKSAGVDKCDDEKNWPIPGLKQL